MASNLVAMTCSPFVAIPPRAFSREKPPHRCFVPSYGRAHQEGMSQRGPVPRRPNRFTGSVRVFRDLPGLAENGSEAVLFQGAREVLKWPFSRPPDLFQEQHRNYIARARFTICSSRSGGPYLIREALSCDGTHGLTIDHLQYR